MKVFIICLFLLRSLTASEIYLDKNNKFDKMLVYINDNVPEGTGLLTRIQDHITRASTALLYATGNMTSHNGGVQFGTVYIRIPGSWNAKADLITWQQCNKADFYITTLRDNDNRNEPFTKQLGKCGEPGNYTRFSETFFKAKSENEMLSAGRKIMNQFVKLRYGVYSEKPYQHQLMAFNGTEFINSACGKDIKWTINKKPTECIEPNKICTYKILPNQNHNHSVLFDTESSRSELFCNERSHNQFAKSLQNRKCNSQSIASIILKHSDFQSNKTTMPPQNINFVIIKGEGRRIALVLDTSGSMEKIIGNMIKAVSYFVKNIVENSSYVGLVNFNSVAFINSQLLSMNDVSNRINLGSLTEQLISKGGTNIPEGLAKGVEVLGSSIADDNKVFGTIFLLTDGENNVDNDKYDSTINKLINKGILVNAIAYGVEADKQLNKLTKGTGGKYLYADPNSNYETLLEKFAVTQNCELSFDREIKVIEGSVTIDINAQIWNLTFIDDYVGINLRITITISINVEIYTFELIGPRNKTFQVTDKFIQTAGTTLTFSIAGKAEKGYYQIQMKSNRSTRFRRSTTTAGATYTVSGTPVSNSSRIILPTGELSNSQIEMLTDTTSLLITVDLTACGILSNEIVTIILTIETPSLKKNDIDMKDDGLGGDSIAGDKIYTVTLFPKNLAEIGFYNFLATVQITNTDTKEIIKRTVTLSSLRIIAKQSNPIVDKIPPAKVEIIELFVTDEAKKRLKVRIYATGDDGMIGNISRYQIMINSSTINTIDKVALASPRDVIDFDLDLVNLKMVNQFEVSVRGIDDSGNNGEWSAAQPFNWNYNSIVDNMGGNGCDKIKISVTFLILSSIFHFY